LRLFSLLFGDSLWQSPRPAIKNSKNMEAATDVDKKKKRTREPESVGQQQQEQGGGMTDSFLSSMTFAAHGAALARGGCDCDECGGAGYIPQAIVDAIRRHKRLKNETAPIKRTQLRELLARQGPIAVYRFTMPLQAEPLVEFGTSHRLVWIKFLPDVSQNSFSYCWASPFSLSFSWTDFHFYVTFEYSISHRS
jgi:hypothetical protein